MTDATTWKDRVPLGLALAAFIVAILGLTPVGEAASTLLDRVTFARDTRAVNGIQASRTPRPNRLLPLGADARFPETVVPNVPGARGPEGVAGDAGPAGTPGPDGGRAIIVHRDDPLEMPQDMTPLTVLRFDNLEAGAFIITASIQLSSVQSQATPVRCALMRGTTELGSAVATLGIDPGSAHIVTLPLLGTVQAGEPGTVLLTCTAGKAPALVDVESAQASALRVASLTNLEVTQ